MRDEKFIAELQAENIELQTIIDAYTCAYEKQIEVAESLRRTAKHLLTLQEINKTMIEKELAEPEEIKSNESG